MDSYKTRNFYSIFFDGLLDFLCCDFCITFKSVFSCINEEQYRSKKPTLSFYEELSFAIFLY